MSTPRIARTELIKQLRAHPVPTLAIEAEVRRRTNCWWDHNFNAWREQTGGKLHTPAVIALLSAQKGP